VLEHAVTPAALAEELCGDELPVAETRVPRPVGDGLCRGALRVESWHLLVDQLSGRVAVGEALRLRPDARVEDSDDHVLALNVAGRGPKTRQWISEAEERRRRCRVHHYFLRLLDAEDTRVGPGLRDLAGRHLRRKAVERVAVVVDLLTAGFGQYGVVPRVEICGVADDVRVLRIDLRPLRRSGCPVPGNPALVRDGRRLHEPNDVHVRARLVPGCLGLLAIRATGHSGRQSKHCGESECRQNAAAKELASHTFPPLIAHHEGCDR
jgi:hypothetical protein